MTVSLKHSKVTTKPDGTDNSLIQPSDWNAEHTLTQATNRLLGRTTAGVGATEEITVGTGLGLGSGTLTADVTSVAGRTGAVTLGVADVSGAAPLASPALTGTPTAPTAAVGTNTTQVATTAYVQAEGYLKSATAASTYAPLASPALTGAPTAPTVATADNSTAIATTAFVKAQSYLTTTTAASTYAPLASPTLTGTPTAPTAAANTNTGQIATTAFVIAQASNATPLMNGTAAVGTATLFAREDHVHPTDTTRAPLASPALTGTPTAPTAASGTNTTQIATTAYVQAEGYLKATTASTTYAPLASPNLTGTPTAPTAAANTNTTQIATTAFVVGQGYLTSSTAASTYAPLASPTFTGTVTIPAGASISGYLTTAAAAAGYVSQTAASGAATLPSGSSAQRPASPAAGQVRYNTNTGKFEGYSTTWGNLGGGAAIGDNPPANPGAGDLWWNSADGNLYVYYTDANTSQWVSVTLGGQGEYLPAAGGTLSGDLNFAGTGRRITGDFSNTTIASRVIFQTSTANSNTNLATIPNGTSSQSAFRSYNNSDPTNAAEISILANSAEARLQSAITGTGTYLPMTFYTGGSERARIDTSGNVGIGTNSPATKLNVFTGSATNTFLRINNTAGTVDYGVLSTGEAYGGYATGTVYYGSSGASPAITFTSGLERMRIDASGNVGIGTSSPSGRLHIAGLSSANQAADLYIARSSSGTAIATGPNIQFSDGTTNNTTALQTTQGRFGVWNYGGGVWAERFCVDSSGNVGIGTSSPGQRLHVVASDGVTNTRLSGASYAVRVQSIASVGALLEATNNTESTYQPLLVGGSQVQFTTSGTERARITSGGDVGIGLTSPGAKLDVKGAGNTSGAFAIKVANSDGTIGLQIRNDGYVGSPMIYANTNANAANVVVTSDGYIYRSTSSLKYKKNVQDAHYGLSELLALRPVTYQGKSGSDTDQVLGGLIAEEVHDAGLTEFVQYAEDGTPDALAYGNMVSLCIKAIQELKAELDAAKAEIAALKGAQ